VALGMLLRYGESIIFDLKRRSSHERIISRA
jgi:hypothetical protein